MAKCPFGFTSGTPPPWVFTGSTPAPADPSAPTSAPSPEDDEAKLMQQCIVPPENPDFPGWAQWAFPFFCALAIIIMIVAVRMRRFLPNWFQRPCNRVFASRANAVSFVVLISSLAIAAIIQLATYDTPEGTKRASVIFARISTWSIAGCFFLSIRPVARLFKVGFERLTILHALLGINALVFGIMHIIMIAPRVSVQCALILGGNEAIAAGVLFLVTFICAFIYKFVPHGYRVFRWSHWLVYIATIVLLTHTVQHELVQAQFSHSAGPYITSAVLFVVWFVSIIERLVELFETIVQAVSTRSKKHFDEHPEAAPGTTYCSKVESITPLTDGEAKEDAPACEIILRTHVKPRPGQWVSVTFPGKDCVAHAFSPLPNPKDENTMKLLVSCDGYMTKKFVAADYERFINTRVYVQGPYGASDLPKQVAGPGDYTVMIAGGTGISPIASVIASLPNEQKEKVSLLWAFRTSGEFVSVHQLLAGVGHRYLMYSGNDEVMRRATTDLEACECPAHYGHMTVGGEALKDTRPSHFAHHGNKEIADFVNKAIAKAEESNAKRINFYMCGPPCMINLTVEAVRSAEIPKGLELGVVKRESFGMMPW
ncbi:Dual oxidase [Perkinsus chesapeaki]|uniref:Dual oxidase n=1 Tax=Perkinsus chesapeaki TaxID=330153 RepID=A0A7J6KUI2_PERCH|nr:Dual oxidase [Perkinsus chesapeaki]